MSKPLGELIDNLYAKRAARLLVTKEVDALKAEETTLREQIIEALDKQAMDKASGKKATCGITESTEPVAKDWQQIHKFIRVENRFDLLQRRLSGPAWLELREAGILVPGTEPIKVRSLSLTKSSRA